MRLCFYLLCISLLKQRLSFLKQLDVLLPCLLFYESLMNLTGRLQFPRHLYPFMIASASVLHDSICFGPFATECSSRAAPFYCLAPFDSWAFVPMYCAIIVSSIGNTPILLCICLIRFTTANFVHLKVVPICPFCDKLFLFPVPFFNRNFGLLFLYLQDPDVELALSFLLYSGICFSFWLLFCFP